MTPTHPHCKHCGEHIKSLPAGQGWVHEDGYKLCRLANPELFIASPEEETDD